MGFFIKKSHISRKNSPHLLKKTHIFPNYVQFRLQEVLQVTVDQVFQIAPLLPTTEDQVLKINRTVHLR